MPNAIAPQAKTPMYLFVPRSQPINLIEEPLKFYARSEKNQVD
jgi:hypothetical protein